MQNLFEEMFQGDNDAFGSSSQCTSSCSNSSSSYVSYTEISNPNKRNSCEMSSAKSNAEGSSSFNTHFQSFCVGVRKFYAHTVLTCYVYVRLLPIDSFLWIIVKVFIIICNLFEGLGRFCKTAFPHFTEL